MLYFEEKITLDYSKIDAKDEGNVAVLKIIIPNNSKGISHYSPCRPTVIILPGGGYTGLSEREADPVAAKYLAHGFNVAILYYSVAPAVYPVALIEALSAIGYIRDNSEKLFADKNRIFVCGFSAGGHLAASCGTLWNRGEAKKYFGNAERVKPNGTILCYPVITSDRKFTHGGSIKALLGDRCEDEKWRDYVSLEKMVDSDTVTSFIWATFEDSTVPCESAMMYAKALREHDIPFDFHIFEGGPHGISTADKLTCGMDYPERTRSWIEMSAEWIKEKAENHHYKIYID